MNPQSSINKGVCVWKLGIVHFLVYPLNSFEYQQDHPWKKVFYSALWKKLPYEMALMSLKVELIKCTHMLHNLRQFGTAHNWS